MLERRSSEIMLNSNLKKNTNMWASTFPGNCLKNIIIIIFIDT